MNEAQKEAYKKDYAEAKRQGKPFFPYAIYKDTIVASLVIGIIIFLAIWARVEVGPEVDPTTDSYVPRPEWYFFFLFELLKIWDGSNAMMPVIMATFIIPNLLLAVLFLWPFIDRGPERRIWKRPVSMAMTVLLVAFLTFTTYKGATSSHGGGTLAIEVPESDTEAFAGKQLFEDSGCLNCHVVGGVGGSLGPDLTNEASQNRGIEWQIEHLKDPGSKVPGSPMPAFGGLTDQQLTELATFLEGLGEKYK